MKVIYNYNSFDALSSKNLGFVTQKHFNILTLEQIKSVQTKLIETDYKSGVTPEELDEIFEKCTDVIASCAGFRTWEELVRKNAAAQSKKQ